MNKYTLVWQLITIIISRCSTYFIRLYPVRKALRVKARVAVFITVSLIAFECLCFVFLRELLPETPHAEQLWLICFSSVMFVAPFLITKNVFWQNLFLLSTLLCGGMVTFSVANWAVANFIWLSDSVVIRAVAQLITYAVFVPIGVIVLDRTVRGWSSGASQFWKVIWLIPLFTTLSQTLLGSILVNPDIEFNWFFLFSRLFTLISTIVLCYVLGSALRQNAEKTAITERAESLTVLNRMKTEFLQDMSHELKTPLTVISVHVQRAAELYMDDGGDNPKINSSLHRAQAEIMRSARMVESALWLASAQENREHSEPLNMTEFLTNSAEAYRAVTEKRGNTLDIDVASDLPTVYGNADKLIQVMANLLTNANTHTENGKITVSAKSGNKELTVTVADNGSGIPPELLSRIFERGVTGSGGAGVGLEICKSIIESHGGTISAESRQGEGAAVTFTLPIWSGDD